MSWSEKREQTPLEQTDVPLQGLFFLDGDVLARVFRNAHTEGLKLAMIAFPSGKEFPLWSVGVADQAIVHLFGEMDLPIRTTRDEAALRAQDIANMVMVLTKAIVERIS